MSSKAIQKLHVKPFVAVKIGKLLKAQAPIEVKITEIWVRAWLKLAVPKQLRIFKNSFALKLLDLLWRFSHIQTQFSIFRGSSNSTYSRSGPCMLDRIQVEGPWERGPLWAPLSWTRAPGPRAPAYMGRRSCQRANVNYQYVIHSKTLAEIRMRTRFQRWMTSGRYIL